jgi:subtilisin family serine protease
MSMGTTGRRKSGERKQGGKKAEKRAFNPRDLDRTVIAIPLIEILETERRPIDIIIDLNLDFAGGIKRARAQVETMIRAVVRDLKKDPRKQLVNSDDEADDGTQYVFATIDRDAIRELVERDLKRGKEKHMRAIYHVWPDFEVNPLIYKSISTVKVDAAHNAFAAYGTDIVWAVADSGIDGTHPHFLQHDTLELPPPLQHRDFTSAQAGACIDAFGHGTHVAGIIAGGMTEKDGTIKATTIERDPQGREIEVPWPLPAITGMAPRCSETSRAASRASVPR